MIKDLRVLSLFSGCGGMDLGFEGGFNVLKRSVNAKIHPNWNCSKIDGKWVKLPYTRFSTVFANDICQNAKIAWINFFQKRGIDDSIYHLESIVDLVKKFRKGEINIFPDKIDVITGGFPCQDFSISGKRLGFNSNMSHLGNNHIDNIHNIENRGQLYKWMREVITIVQPKIFIAENVKGLTNLSNAKMIIEKDFADAGNGGYLVLPAKVLHVANYGVPQNRERVIFFGFKKSALRTKALEELSKEKIDSEYDPYPLYTHRYSNISEANNDLYSFIRALEYLDDLPEPKDALDLSQQKYSKAKFGGQSQGQTEINPNGIAPLQESKKGQ